METDTTVNNKNKEELQNRLKQKINSKKTNRTNGLNRKKTQTINDSFKKITEILIRKDIKNPDELDSNTIDLIMDIISKKDLELVLLRMQENSKFKELLQSINDKLTN